jgi:hypothetical protein
MSWRLGFFLALVLAAPLARGFPPYYDIAEHDAAQAEARQRHLPVAWLGGFPEDLNVGTPQSGSQADLEQMALSTLRDNAVIIFFDGRNMAPVPPLVHAQFHIQDDGPLPNGANWKTPKVVFTDPEVTRILGRVAETQMAEDREVSLNSALQLIRNDPTALAPPASPDSAPTAPTLAPASTMAPTGPGGGESQSSLAWSAFDFLSRYGVYLALGALCLCVLLFVWAWSRRRA